MHNWLRPFPTPAFATYGSYARLGAFMMGVDMRWFDPTTSGPGLMALPTTMANDEETAVAHKAITAKAANNALMAYLEYGAFPSNIIDVVYNYRIKAQVWAMDAFIVYGIKKILD